MDDYITLIGFGFPFVFLLVLMRGFLLMFQDPINGSKPREGPDGRT